MYRVGFCLLVRRRGERTRILIRVRSFAIRPRCNSVRGGLILKLTSLGTSVGVHIVNTSTCLLVGAHEVRLDREDVSAFAITNLKMWKRAALISAEIVY